ncbi:MAG TPA: flagellar hook-length control protein FliK, partial [Bacteroidales bacterium]|nr:flagellar hook-length control protein FliK [Bacteroidales bacterium]
PDRVQIDRDLSGRLIYEVSNERGANVLLEPSQLFHVRGLTLDGVTGENLETSTSIFGIEDKTTFRQDFEVENKEFQEINKKIIFEQIVEKAKLIVDDNKQEIRIKLKPDILGELILKMEVEKGEFLAKILVDNYRTKELLEASLHEFKENMKENGLEIKTFEVFVGTNEDFERENRQEFFFNKKPSKLKIKNNGLKEIQAYDETLIDNKIDIYYEGQLNLLA